MAFKTSVNIRFDVGNDEFINRYIPTPSHSEVLKSVLDGFINNGDSSHIIIGAYGTGKSLLATVVSSIVSKNISTKAVEKLINKFNHFDNYIAKQIQAAYNLERKYIPILLTGNEGRFRQAILSNVVRALKLLNIDIILPGVCRKILDAIKMWKNEFPSTYETFIDLLTKNGKEIEKWIDEIKKQNENEIKFFVNIYPKLTSGATFDFGFNESLITQMEYVTEVLEENNLGILLVYDEFGRFLQELNSSQLNETMQDIQDLAELVNRKNSLQLMLITHKSLRQYFKGMHDEVSKEFQKIEKRFRQYHITSDQATFLKIAEVILTENIQHKPQIKKEEYEKTLSQLKKFPLFPSLNPTVKEKVIVKLMYPLHPVTLFMLPHLSNVFGQNERTLFTFLESEETGGLYNHMLKSTFYYRPYQLFDYFFPNPSENDVDLEVAHHIFLYKKAVARIPDNLINKKYAFNFIKFITLWNLCGLQKEQKLSSNFLKFAMQDETNEVEEILDILSEHKVIRFNRVGEYWELHTGSSIDIHDKIESKKAKYILNKGNILKVLTKNLGKKYYFPEKYNDEKDMTRFAKVQIILEDDLDGLKPGLKKDSDLSIYYVIPQKDLYDDQLIKKISSLSRLEDVIFAVHSVPLETIKNELLESYIIEELLRDKEFLSEEKGVKEELNLLLKEANFVVYKYLSSFTEFDETVLWITDTGRKHLKSEIDLSELLSEKCNSLYPDTPKIINDSFNRMNISVPQKKGAISLIDGIINCPNECKFGIQGSGPDYAIYASIFKNNGRFDLNVNNLDYSNIKYPPYRLLRTKLVNLLDEKPRGNFNDIVNIFTAPPFGIRKPVVPILLVAMLRDRWNEFMLYRNEMFVPGLNGEKLYEILDEEGPENYQYVYEKIDEEYIEFFNSLENHFSDFIEERLEGEGKSRLIQICGTLVKWLRSLPRFTQLTNLVNGEFSNLRDLIRRTEVKPQKSIAEIFEKYRKDNIVELLRVKEYAESFLDNFKDSLINSIFQTCDVTSFDMLKIWAESLHEYVKKNNKLARTVLSIRNQNWLECFVGNYIGVQVEDWSDTTYELFKNQLKQDYYDAVSFKETKQDDSQNHDFINLKIGNKTKVISKVEFSVKTKTIYTNIDRIIRNAGRNIPKKELEYMIYVLMEQYID